MEKTKLHLFQNGIQARIRFANGSKTPIYNTQLQIIEAVLSLYNSSKILCDEACEILIDMSYSSVPLSFSSNEIDETAAREGFSEIINVLCDIYDSYENEDFYVTIDEDLLKELQEYFKNPSSKN